MGMIPCWIFVCLNYNLHSKRHVVAPVADRHLKIYSEIPKHIQNGTLTENNSLNGDKSRHWHQLNGTRKASFLHECYSQHIPLESCTYNGYTFIAASSFEMSIIWINGSHVPL